MYYKHSGRFSLVGLMIAAITGGAASLVLAYLYAHGLILIPEVHLALLAPVVFGALIGAATGYGLVWGKVRNDSVGMALTGVIATLALYISWVMWVPAVLESQHIENLTWTRLAQHPGALWQFMRLINQYGTWGLNSGSATTGWALWVIWFLEAAFVIGIAPFLGVAVLNRRPFCEACGTWCDRSAKMVLAAPQDAAQLKLQLEANDLRSLESLGPGNKSSDHLIVVLDSCGRCRQFNTISLTQVTIRRSKSGKATFNNKVIVQTLLIGPGQAEVVRHLAEKVAQASNTIPKVNAAAAGKK